MTADPLAAIDAALGQRCGHCGDRIPPSSPSAYFCDDEHQLAWTREQARDAASVEYSEDPNYRYPPGPMRWVPGLVSEEPDIDLEVATDVPDALHYGGRLRLNPTIYRRRGRDSWHLRLDDGYRYVGRDLAAESAETAARVWAALERELRDPSRAAPPEPRPLQVPDRVWLLPFADDGRRPRPGVAQRPDPRVDRQAPPESIWREHWCGTRAGEDWPEKRRCPQCLTYGPVSQERHDIVVFGERTPQRPWHHDYRCGNCGFPLPDLEVVFATDPGTLTPRCQLLLIVGPDTLGASIRLGAAEFDTANPGQVYAYLETVLVTRRIEWVYRPADLRRMSWPELRHLLLTGHLDPVVGLLERATRRRPARFV